MKGFPNKVLPIALPGSTIQVAREHASLCWEHDSMGCLEARLSITCQVAREHDSTGCPGARFAIFFFLEDLSYRFLTRGVGKWVFNWNPALGCPWSLRARTRVLPYEGIPY